MMAATPSGVKRFHDVGHNRLRHLRDGREAFPAMIEAIDSARREILLEMYCVGDDAVGAYFRDRLAMRAHAGVAVYVTYDGIGSLGLAETFWEPLLRAGARVAEIRPAAPWRRGFRLARLLFRDHRKILVVDGELSFCGGLNLALPWLPREDGGADWRDDAIQIRGPASLELRALACDTWYRNGREGPPRDPLPVPATPGPTRVLANRVDGRPDRRIRRAYLVAIRRARKSIDITSAYFLPGPLFLHAMREATKRGVVVRVLVPRVCDVWLVGLAMTGVIDKLLRDGIEVFVYERAVLHAKTAVLDERFVVIGSHNLDTFSWRFNLEANVVVDDRGFASDVVASFERDLDDSTRLELNALRERPWLTRLLAWAAAYLRAFL